MKKPDRFTLQASPEPGVYRNGKIWHRWSWMDSQFRELVIGGRVVLEEVVVKPQFLKKKAKNGR